MDRNGIRASGSGIRDPRSGPSPAFAPPKSLGRFGAAPRRSSSHVFSRDERRRADLEPETEVSRLHGLALGAAVSVLECEGPQLFDDRQAHAACERVGTDRKASRLEIAVLFFREFHRD